MKNQVFKLMILIACLTGYHNSFGQCTGGSLGSAITMTTAWQTQAATGNRYYTFAATVGSTYYFSFCAADGGSTSYNTQISLMTNAGVGVAGGYNDDYCGTASYLEWTCTTAGTYRALMTKSSCANQAGLGTFAYRYLPATCPAGLGTGVTNVASLPYASGASTTCGALNDVFAARMGTTCGTTSYYAGEDKAFIFTPTVTGRITINLTTAANNVILSAFDACPLVGGGATCLGSSEGNSNRSLTFCVASGTTYYVLIDCQIATGCFAYTNLTISAPQASFCTTTCPAGLGTGVTNVASLPYASGAGTTCGMVNDFDNTTMITCGTGSYYDGEDAAWIFTPTQTGRVTITLANTASNVSLSAYNNCPLTGGGATCLGSSQGNNTRSLTFCVTAGTTYYIVADCQLATACFAYTNLTISAPQASFCTTACPVGLGTGVTNVASLPYASGAGTTCGMVNDFDNTTMITCGGTSYYDGEDRVWIFTPTQTGRVIVSIANSASNVSLSAYDACPLTGGGATCLGNSQGNNTRTLTFCVTAGTTYYIVADCQLATACFAYTNLTISAPQASFCTTSCPAGLGTGVTNVASLPYTSGAGTTCGMVNDFDNTTMVTCGGTSYYDGEDRVWIFTPTLTGRVTVSLANSASNVSLSAYDACPLTGGGATCLGNSQGNNTRTLTFCVNAGTTYYIVADCQLATSCFAYTNLTISAPQASFCTTTCPDGLGTGVTNVPSLPYASGAGTTCGMVNDFDNTTMVTCGTGTYYAGEDRAWIFTPTLTGRITITLTNAASNVSLSAYDACPLTGGGATCLGSSQGNNTRTLTFCVIAGTTYYVIADCQIGTACFAYTNLTITAPQASFCTTVCPTGLGTGVTNVVSLPYASGAGTTCGAVNDFDNTTIIAGCGTGTYYAGEDKVWIFTPTLTGRVTVTLTNTASNVILSVFNNCPLTGGGATCMGNSQGSNTRTVTFCAIAGTTYYVIADCQIGTACFAYTNLTITAPQASFCTTVCPAGLGTGVTNVASLPYANGAGTTCGMVNDFDNTTITTCGTGTYYAGEDMVWIFTPATTGQVTINLNNAASNVSLSAYLGCPLTGGGATCMGSSQGNNTRTLAFCVTAGQTYYVVVDAQIGTGCFAFTDLTISAPVYTVACDYSCPTGLGTGVTSVSSLPYTNGAGTTCGAVNDFDATRITTCGTASYYAGEDMVWSFIPSSAGSVTVTLNTTASNVSLSVYLNCPLNGNGATCMGSSQGTGDRTLTFCVTAGQTYYAVVDAQIGTGCFTFTDLSITAPSSACVLGTGQLSITLPFSSTGRTTCGKVDDINAANVIACGDNSFMASEDEVFVFTATATGTSIIKVNTAGVNSAIYVYDGCPLSAYCGVGSSSCVTSRTGTGDKTICAGLIAGHTYYIIIDSKTTCFTYGISITAPVATLPGETCGNPYLISTLPTLINAESTECYGDDYDNTSPASCGTSYESGEDKVYRYVATGPVCLSISITGASTNNVGLQIYSGCPSTVGSTCVKSLGGATSGVLSTSVSLPSAGTYYIVVDTWSAPSYVQYNLKIENNGSVDNDLPCNAQPMALGFFYSGTNHCSSGGGDPAAPACWVTPNTINSVWYSFVAPASGSVVIRTALGTLKNTQIALYSGVCGSGLTLLTCNDNAPACGGSGTTATAISQITRTGLTAGITYYIVVDGYGTQTGTFSIIVNDGGVAALPDLAGQDCGWPIIVCSGTTAVGNPGFSDFGNKCDFPGSGSNCLSTAERGSVWYQMNISAAGTLEFNIVPNDWPGAPSTTSTDYDFAIWKIAGTGATSCAGIAGGAAPVRCNYSALGVTGCYAVSGNSPAAYPGYNGSYETGITVAAGEVYLLVVSNYSNSTSGFTMTFPGTAPVDYTAGQSSVYWTGSVDNDWFKIENWGGCNIPSCTVDATILSAAANQPYISAAGASCKTLNLQPGSVLNINASRTLSICQNVFNNGNILGSPTSTLSFSNAAVVQNINGNLLYPNDIGNILVNKTGGNVNLLQNVDISGSLTVNNATSVFNARNKTINLYGNLTVNLGEFNMDTTGILKLVGTTNQIYDNDDTLTNIIVNKPSGYVNMSSRMLISDKGVLTLTNGKVVTNSSHTLALLNTANTRIVGGSASSYVEGYIRQAVPATMSPRQYYFPVGNSVSGYENINMNFFNGITPAIGNLRVNFISWPSNPPKTGNDPECWVTYQDTMLDNGYWAVLAAGAGSADANVTLNNLNYTNAKTQFCVARSTDATTFAIPALNSGLCTTPPVTAVLRNATANTFTAGSFFYFGTAQGYPSPLPVELVSLVAKAEKKSILVSWITASENNNEGFYLQRSTNGSDFNDIKWIPGAGNVNTEQFYSYDDKDVVEGIEYYYRLKQVDFDGKSTLTEVVNAMLGESNGISLTASPNPYKGSTNIHYKLPAEGNVKIIISDVTGRVVRQIDNGFQQAGSYSVPFSAIREGLRGGMYYVTLYFNDNPYRIQITELN